MDSAVPAVYSTLGSRRFINGFEILNPLGRGLYSTVHLVQEFLSGIKYAMKVYPVAMLENKRACVFDEDGVLNITELDKVHNDVNIHHSLPLDARCFGRQVQVISDDRHSQLCIVMEYFPGGQLLQWNNRRIRYSAPIPIDLEFPELNEKQRMSTEHAWFALYKEEALRPLARSLFMALHHLHSRSIVHKDIKPDNVLLSSPAGANELEAFFIADDKWVKSRERYVQQQREAEEQRMMKMFGGFEKMKASEAFAMEQLKAQAVEPVDSIIIPVYDGEERLDTEDTEHVSANPLADNDLPTPVGGAGAAATLNDLYGGRWEAIDIMELGADEPGLAGDLSSSGASFGGAIGMKKKLFFDDYEENDYSAADHEAFPSALGVPKAGFSLADIMAGDSSDEDARQDRYACDRAEREALDARLSDPEFYNQTIPLAVKEVDPDAEELPLNEFATWVFSDALKCSNEEQLTQHITSLPKIQTLPPLSPCSHDEEWTRCVLADFNTAILNDDRKDLAIFDAEGTQMFVAPEAFAPKEEDYDFDWSTGKTPKRKSMPGDKRDTYALGALMWVCLFGSPPFGGDTSLDLQLNILYADLEVPDFRELSAECLDLLLRLLCKDPAERMGVQEALAHPWMLGQQTMDTTVAPFDPEDTDTEEGDVEMVKDGFAA